MQIDYKLSLCWTFQVFTEFMATFSKFFWWLNRYVRKRTMAIMQTSANPFALRTQIGLFRASTFYTYTTAMIHASKLF